MDAAQCMTEWTELEMQRQKSLTCACGRSNVVPYKTVTLVVSMVHWHL